MVCKQCCDKRSRTLHTRSTGGPASSSSFTVGAGGVGRKWRGGNGGEGLRGQAWGPGHPWELHRPQAHKGWRVDLWSPWGRSDTLWTQGAALNSLSPHNSVYQPGQQDGFTSWLSCQICSWPSSIPHCPPGSARPGGWGLQLTERAPPPAAPRQQLPAND